MSTRERMRSWASAFLAGLAVCATQAHAALPGPVLKESPEALQSALKCTPGPADTTKKTPILLVHGTGGAASENWSWGWGHVLPDMGYPTCTVDLPDRALVDMQRSVEYVVHAVRFMSEHSGRKISILGHSQGGFLPTFALRFWPDLPTKVDDFVGFAPATGRGTESANVVCAKPCPPAGLQFLPSSRLNVAYNSRSLPAGPDYTSILSLADFVVSPQPAASTLERGRTIPLQSLCPGRPTDHVTIVGDAVAYALAMDALTHPGPADPARIPDTVCLEALMPGADVAKLAGALPTVLPGFVELLATYPGATTVEPPVRCELDPACPKARLQPGLRSLTTPARDRRPPWRFQTGGELVLPEGSLSGCDGTVVVRVSRAGRTIARRRATIGGDCRFSASVTLRRGRGILRVHVRYPGNGALLPASARARRVRAG